MGYKSSTVIFLEITSGFLTPVPLYGDFETIFFEIFFLKVTRTNKSTMLMTNIAVRKFKNVVLKN